MTQLDAWVKNLNKTVFLEWKSKYSSWKKGYKIFYGPVQKNPKLMIISHNPSGSEYYFQTEDLVRFQRGDFSAPTTNSYTIRKNSMAKRMQDLFRESEIILKESVTFPILFFRSRDVKTWKAVPKKQRFEMEQFCYSKVKEIFEHIKPKKILVLGFRTDRKLKKHIFNDFSEGNILKNSKNRKLGYSYSWKKVPIFCMIHPTGNRISTKDWIKIKQKFYQFVDH